MAKRATFEELLEFANKVREAGGGNPLDALMPAVPSSSSRCLIAKNLNFNCTVGSVQAKSSDHWVMAVTTKEIRDKIADALNLETIDTVDWGYKYGLPDDPDGSYNKIDVYGVILPDNIGQVAAEFDSWNHALTGRYNDHLDYIVRVNEHASDGEIQRLKDFAPYLEASVKETVANGIFDENGDLIL